MLITIYRTITSFALRRPKITALIGVGIIAGAFWTHYSLVKYERNKLRVAEAGYKKAVAAFLHREEIMREDARIAAVAAAAAIAERDAARRTLETLRKGRENDPESVKWGARLIPQGEQARLCVALPRMTGCENTPSQ